MGSLMQRPFRSPDAGIRGQFGLQVDFRNFDEYRELLWIQVTNDAGSWAVFPSHIELYLFRSFSVGILGRLCKLFLSSSTADRKFEDVVKSAQQAAVLVLVY